MICDYSMQLSNGQAVTVSAPTANVLDMGVTGQAVYGPNPFIGACVTTPVTASGSATVAFAVQTSDDESFAAYDTVLTHGPVAAAKLGPIRMSVGGIIFKRYVRGYYTVASGPLTAGAFDMYVADGVDLPHR